MHFKIVGKLLLPRGTKGPHPNGQRPQPQHLRSQPPALSQLVTLPAADAATDVEGWRPVVLTNCCNEITAKFSVCCIIKKFEKLLPKLGNCQPLQLLRPALPHCLPLANCYKPTVMRRLQFLHDWQPNSQERREGRTPKPPKTSQGHADACGLLLPLFLLRWLNVSHISGRLLLDPKIL